MEKKPTSKWKPLPLTTLELQTNGTKYLHMNSQRVMQVAEALYTKGFISYPRTETDRFDQGMDLRGLIQKQTQAPNWGQYAQGLLNGGFQWPRAGGHDDKAHPPIHPVNYVAPGALNQDEQRLYEFVVRRFLACCSEDAKGMKSTVEIEYGSEGFHANGLIVLERNYLDVYPYDKWTSSEELPNYTVGETFVPTEALMKDGKTSPPHYITEPELLRTMDANGIGTDATMQEHITRIQDRNYVLAREVSRSVTDEDNNDESVDSGGSRGGRRGGRGRGSRANGTTRGSGSVNEFIPTNLGVALIEGYNNLQFETSLSKPFLRKEVRVWLMDYEPHGKFLHVVQVLTNFAHQMELQMTAICQGTQTRNDVVRQNLERYRAVFARTTQEMDVLKAVSVEPLPDIRLVLIGTLG
jgi:DNA topoisomerase-3